MAATTPADRVSIEEQIKTVERELQQRGRVYPRLVENKKMSAEFAAQQTENMKAVLLTLRSVAGPTEGRLI